MRSGGSVLLIAIGLVVLYVAVTGKYDCFTSLFSCLLEVPLQRASEDAYYSDPETGVIPGPGQPIPQAGGFFPFPGGGGTINIPGLGPITIPNFPGSGGAGTPPTFPNFGGGLGGILGGLGGIFGRLGGLNYPGTNIPPLWIPLPGTKGSNYNPFPLRGYSFFDYLPGGQWGKDTFGTGLANPREILQ